MILFSVKIWRRISYQNKNKLGADIVSVNPAYFRPTEVELLTDDLIKLKTVLVWKSEYDLTTLIKHMMQS